MVKVDCGITDLGAVRWPDMSKVYPRRRVIGGARVEPFEISRHGAAMESLRGTATRDGWYARLYVDDRLVMSNTHHEQITCSDVVQQATGSVLVAGLGMGMILFPMVTKPEVERILVLEKNRDVIALIGPSVRHRKIEILEADIFEWRPERARKWNTIWFDIWPDLSVDNLPEIKILHQRYKGHLDRTGRHWMGSWCQDELRAQRRAGQRNLMELLS